jgi:hypothetical protein
MAQASHNGGPGSIPGHYMRDLWWTKWHWDRFFSQYFCFPCQYHYTSASNLSSSSTCCSYQTDKRTKPGNLPKSSTLSEIRKVRRLSLNSYRVTVIIQLFRAAHTSASTAEHPCQGACITILIFPIGDTPPAEQHPFP